ncbi:unnamed protein product [Saccharomyces cerevisiae]|nr:unnamed protein product [Saccharomyces cerevisiae]
MTIAHHCIFLVILAFLELLNVASGSTQACLPVGPRKNGMNINFYEYTICDKTTYLEPEYMGYKYSDTKKLGSVSGQTYLSIYFSPNPVSTIKKRDTDYCDSNTASWSYFLGFYTTPTNVTVEMTGYFLPPQTGSYTFKFATVDDSAILSVGGATAFDCCAQQQPPITSTDFTINGIKPWGGSLPPNVEGTVYMYAGFYYPMKIVYSNADAWGMLPISVELPDGTTVSDDFEGYVYSFDDDLTQSDCTIPDPSKYTITGLITTTTEPWTGTFTSTSTEMTTVTGTNGQSASSASDVSSSVSQSASSTSDVSSSVGPSSSSVSDVSSSVSQSSSSASDVSSSVSQSASSTSDVSSSVSQSASSASDVSSSVSQSASSTSDVSSSVGPSSSSVSDVSSSVSQSSSSASDVSSSVSQSASSTSDVSSSVSQSASSASDVSSSVSQSASSTSDVSSSVGPSSSSVSDVSSSVSQSSSSASDVSSSVSQSASSTSDVSSSVSQSASSASDVSSSVSQSASSTSDSIFFLSF